MDWLTADLVQPIVENVEGAATILIPIGIGIMAVMIGISLFPKIIYKFF
jgi:hypothetical protein